MSIYKLSEVSKKSEWNEVVSAIEEMISNDKEYVVNFYEKKKDFKSLDSVMVIECPSELSYPVIKNIISIHTNLRFGKINESETFFPKFTVISVL